MRTRVILIALLVSSYIMAQGKFKMHSISAGFGGFYIKKSNSENGGASFVFEATIASRKNLINLNCLTGSEIGILGTSTLNFSELSLSYGREFHLEKWLKLEGLAGIGTYKQNGKISNFESGNSLSFPLKMNVKFFFNDKFGMGLLNNYSINNLNNNLSTNLILHYNF